MKVFKQKAEKQGRGIEPARSDSRPSSILSGGKKQKTSVTGCPLYAPRENRTPIYSFEGCRSIH